MFNAETQRRRVRREVWPCRTCRTWRGGWEIFNAEAQRRRVRRGDGRVEHVERVEGERVSQGAPSLRDGAMKSEYSHQ